MLESELSKIDNEILVCRGGKILRIVTLAIPVQSDKDMEIAEKMGWNSENPRLRFRDWCEGCKNAKPMDQDLCWDCMVSTLVEYNIRTPKPKLYDGKNG